MTERRKWNRKKAFKYRRSYETEEPEIEKFSPEAEKWVSVINTSWQKGVETILETGRALAKAQAELQRGEWTALFKQKRFSFGMRTAQMLMEIAEHEIISNAKFVSRLPPSWGTLHEIITEIPTEALEGLLADGTINPEITRHEVGAIAADLRQQGTYDWKKLGECICLLIKFMNQWPKGNVMATLVKWPTLPLPSAKDFDNRGPWITAFAAGYRDWERSERGNKRKNLPEKKYRRPRGWYRTQLEEEARANGYANPPERSPEVGSLTNGEVSVVTGIEAAKVGADE
jgi:hypothetical protein